MGTRIIQFGVVPDGIFAALSANGYEVDACGTSIPKLERALKQPNLDAIALTEHDASRAAAILPTIRSHREVPLILLQDESRTCDPSQFDLVIPEHTSLSDLLKKVAAVIERSRAIHAKTNKLGERFHTLLRKTASLHEQSVTARVESHRLEAKLQRGETERVGIPSVLVVDDHPGWRDAMGSLLRDYADCGLLSEAANGIEAVERAAELKPRLILLDLNLPLLNGIEAARDIARCSPDSVILFVSMNNSAEVVRYALSTGAKGYVLKMDAGTELWPAIDAVLQNKQFLSRSLRGLYSEVIN